MNPRIGIFWPGDYRGRPNELALPGVTEATVQLERALARLGRASYRIEGFLTRPHEAIEQLGPIDDPLIGVCTHWFYGSHTCDGVIGKDSPLLLASNFSGTWPGLVGLLNTGACLASIGREFSRVWTSAADWSADESFMARLDEWCRTGRIEYPADEIGTPAAKAAGPPADATRTADESRTAHANSGRASAASAPTLSRVGSDAASVAQQVRDQIRRRRILALMLGDTSMGMINGYFGPRLLNPIGFTEHKVDQAWIIDRGARIEPKRIENAFKFVRDRGVTFHWREPGAEDFDENATREQLRDYLTVFDLVREFKADCLGWQYQLGLLPLRPPSDFAEGLFNSACRPESDGNVIITATEADQGNLVPMELMKRLLAAKGLHPAVMFHDVRWGGEHDGRFVWVLLNSGSCGAYAFNHDPATLRGVHSYRQPVGYFPVPGGTFAGESLPGKVTWARAWIQGSGWGPQPRSVAVGDPCGVQGSVGAVPDRDLSDRDPTGTVSSDLWMDIGRGEVVKLPEPKRDAWWNGTTRQWPFMAADLGVRQDTIMAHYMSNHIAVAYGDIFDELVLLSQSLGFRVRVFGAA